MMPMSARDRSRLQPDVILISNFFGALRRPVLSTTGEFRLLFAVLENAIDYFQKHLLSRKVRQRRLYDEAVRWIMEDGPPLRLPNDVEPLSFTYICEVLGIEPTYLRRGLDDWRRQQLERAGFEPGRQGSSASMAPEPSRDGDRGGAARVDRQAAGTSAA